ncbi:MAG: hypothetical protein M1833_000762 [Piccolia ochrophora]|nr:MAG: hypothetical protein M1833_000762 [Piccolia ochrophora]
MSTQGMIPPPPGITPNFVDPPSIAYRLIVLFVVGTFISTSFIIMRLYTKARIIRAFGAEDVFCTLAWICTLVVQALMCAQISGGAGRHFWDVPKSRNFNKHYRLTPVTTTFYSLSMMLAKISIIIFYRRIWPQKAFRMTLWGLMGFTIAYSVAISFAQLLSCRPLAKTYDFFTAGKCINTAALYYSNASFNIFTDLALLVLPIFMLRHVQIRRPEKCAVAILFALGSAQLEIFLAIVCASISIIRPFLRHFFPRMFKTKSTYYASSDYGTHKQFSDKRSYDGSRSIKQHGRARSFSSVHPPQHPHGYAKHDNSGRDRASHIVGQKPSDLEMGDMVNLVPQYANGVSRTEITSANDPHRDTGITRPERAAERSGQTNDMDPSKIHKRIDVTVR